MFYQSVWIPGRKQTTKVILHKKGRKQSPQRLSILPFYQIEFLWLWHKPLKSWRFNRNANVVLNIAPLGYVCISEKFNVFQRNQILEISMAVFHSMFSYLKIFLFIGNVFVTVSIYQVVIILKKLLLSF